MKDKNNHGGKRPNSGAKQKYGEPTKSVTFRIPLSKIQTVKKVVYNFIKADKLLLSTEYYFTNEINDVHIGLDMADPRGDVGTSNIATADKPL